MDPLYDSYYASRYKFVILSCQTYYDPINEAADPQIVSAVTALNQVWRWCGCAFGFCAWVARRLRCPDPGADKMCVGLGESHFSS